MPNFSKAAWTAKSPVTLPEAFGLTKGTFKAPVLTAQLPNAVGTASTTSNSQGGNTGTSNAALTAAAKSAGNSATNQQLGQSMAAAMGWTGSEWTALQQLWTRESGWRTDATNPSSGAYGIPQSLPGSKMASAGADWKTNPVTQIIWGLGYIKGRYGKPSTALAHENAVGWY